MDINYISDSRLNKELINKLAICEYISEHWNLFSYHYVKLHIMVRPTWYIPLLWKHISIITVVENEKRRLRTKEDGSMNSSAFQNPSDPDATYRNKSGKLYRGYVANIEETVGKNGSVVTDYQYDKNTHTDSHFLQESLS